MPLLPPGTRVTGQLSRVDSVLPLVALPFLFSLLLPLSSMSTAGCTDGHRWPSSWRLLLLPLLSLTAPHCWLLKPSVLPLPFSNVLPSNDTGLRFPLVNSDSYGCMMRDCNCDSSPLVCLSVYVHVWVWAPLTFTDDVWDPWHVLVSPHTH